MCCGNAISIMNTSFCSFAWEITLQYFFGISSHSRFPCLWGYLSLFSHRPSSVPSIVRQTNTLPLGHGFSAQQHFPFFSASANMSAAVGPQQSYFLTISAHHSHSLSFLHPTSPFAMSCVPPSLFSHFLSVHISPSSRNELGVLLSTDSYLYRDSTSHPTKLFGGQFVLGDRTSNISDAFVSRSRTSQCIPGSILLSHTDQRSRLARTHSTWTSSPTCLCIAVLPGGSAWRFCLAFG